MRPYKNNKPIFRLSWSWFLVGMTGIFLVGAIWLDFLGAPNQGWNPPSSLADLVAKIAYAGGYLGVVVFGVTITGCLSKYGVKRRDKLFSAKKFVLLYSAMVMVILLLLATVASFVR